MKFKKMKLLIAVMLVASSIMLTGCDTSTSGGGSEAGSTQTTEELTEVESDKEINAAGIQGFDYSFILEGKKYTLPFDYAVLEKDGWEPLDDSEDPNDKIDGMKDELFSMKKVGKERKNGEMLTVWVFNGSGNKRKIKDCKIGGIVVAEKDLGYFSFELSNGLKPGDEQETVRGIMGEPDEFGDWDSFYKDEYGEKKETGLITFEWKKDEIKDKGEDYIRIFFCPPENTESSDEVPEYLSGYQKPDSMGNDFDSATFTLDQAIYKLPCPVSEFVKNGWIPTKTEDVPSGGDKFCDLKKDGSEIKCMVENFADYQTYSNNCAVTRVYMDYTSAGKTIPDILLPKNVKQNMSL